MEHKVSIVVAAYNVERYIKQCVDSLIDQSFSNIEIVVVNDGSTDSTPEILKEYEKCDSRVILIHQENKGLVEARKTGIRNASGKYLLIVDGDDWIDADYVNNLVEAIEKNNSEMVVTDYFLSYRNENKPVSMNLDEGVYIGPELEQLKRSFLYSGTYYDYKVNPSLWNKMFILDIYKEKCMGTPSVIRFGEDLATLIPYIRECSGISYDKGCIGYHYRQCKNSMVRKYDPAFKNRIDVLMDYIFTITGSSYELELYHYLSWIFLSMLDNQFAEVKQNRTGLKEAFEPVLSDTVFIDALTNVLEEKIPAKYRLVFSASVKKDYMLLYLLEKYKDIRNARIKTDAYFD